MIIRDFILVLYLIAHAIHAQEPSNEPSNSPTYNLIGASKSRGNNTQNDLFVIPNITLSYYDAEEYCATHYHGLANIYDPKENNQILQLVNLNFITHAFIGYRKSGSQWKWQSNVSSNPMLWLQTPLAQITSNIEYAHTKCIFTSRYGWQYTECIPTAYNFVCETREHKPQFITSGAYKMATRKLTFNHARSLCRAQGYDLATIYEEEEYLHTQSLCANNTNNATNCWIGYRRGVLNQNEWLWTQDIPTSVIPTNRLINTDLWSINPWQHSVADINCQATLNLTISYSSDGERYIGNTSGEFRYNHALNYHATSVLHDSKILFEVQTIAGVLPGLKCTIHFEDDLYNTQVNDYLHWNIVSYSADYDDDIDPYTILEANSFAGNQQTPPKTIDTSAHWLWNYVYKNKSYVTAYSSVTFEFLFEHVKNVQNRPNDDCAAISYYPPYKWKTNNCQSAQHFICNARDHKPVFIASSDDKFALLTDRTLTRKQSAALCQNIYGYGLAIVYSYYEFTEIDDMLHDNDITDAWIGLYHDNTTFINSNNLDNHYGWSSKREFIFDTWTQDVFSFIDPPNKDETCVIQSKDQWTTHNCNSTSYALCNIGAHSPNFTASQLGAFYLLDEPQNYLDGEEMCRDYVGIRSKGATIYHPIENERAKWLCSNATNGRGCFIGYNNIEYRNESKFRWRNGALIDVQQYPWFGNPWLNTSIYDENDNNISDYCTAIMPNEENANEWGWKLVDCEEELNMLCDSGDDHAQCWMLQNCAQCAIRSDCQWCDDRCQLTDEICYSDEIPIKQEFGCPDFDPVVNITYQQNVNYTYTVNITMCASTAHDSVPTAQLFHYVNHSNCVLQQQVVQFYVISDWEAAMYGNYNVLGKVIELRQSTRNPGGEQFQNITTFEDANVCDIHIFHGYVRSITCDNKGAGYQKNITQFDMLHDVLRYLLPRLQSRLFEGWDIPQHSLFGYSTMQRSYDDSSGDHSIHKKFTKEAIKDERYANATSDLLWEHRHTIEAGNTEIKHMNFDMIHVFARLPHHEESEQRQLFTWCGYELTLFGKDSITSKTTTRLKKGLYDLVESDRLIKNYTIDEWRGIRPGNYMRQETTQPQDGNNNEYGPTRRRQLGFVEGIEKFCGVYNNLTGQRGETQFEIWGLNVWVSQIVHGLKTGKSFLKIMEAASGYHGALDHNKPLVIIPNFLELDLGFKVHFGFGWDYKTKTEYIIDEDGDEFYDAKQDEDDDGFHDTKQDEDDEWTFDDDDEFSDSKFDDDGFVSDSSYLQKLGEEKKRISAAMKHCPFSFQLTHQLMPNALSKEAMSIVAECCSLFAESQRDCDKTLAQAHADANKCLLDKGLCSVLKDDGMQHPQSVMTGAAIYEWDDGEPPNVNSIIRFVMFFINEGWEEVIHDIKEIMQTFVFENAMNTVCNKGASTAAATLINIISKRIKSYDVTTLIDFSKQIGKIMARAKYIQYKGEKCIRKNGPILLDFDIWFHFGVVNPTLRGLCKKFSGLGKASDFIAEPEDNDRRRLQYGDNSLSFPIIPDLTLPCIPIAPPWLMLCPALNIATNFGLGVDPDFDFEHVGAQITPHTSFDLDASLSLTIGILLFEADIVLGVHISFAAVSFPFDIGIYFKQFGIFGDIGIDIKVLEFRIYLQFKLCIGFWIFKFCPLNIILWQFSVVAYEYQRTLAQWGMGSAAERSALPSYADLSDITTLHRSLLTDSGLHRTDTKIRFYWAFKDSETAYNHEYDYGWHEKYFNNTTYDDWADYLLDLTSCQIKDGYISSKTWYLLKDHPEMMNITEPYACKYNMEGFDKLYVIEITVQWWSELGMKTCFDAKTKAMFKEKHCCNFALTTYDYIHELTGIKFHLSSYKMIVMDLYQNWAKKCAQFYLNVEEQIDQTPYYDDCSDEGWRIGKGLSGEYHLGFHNIFGENSMTHFNRKHTCLNWYNSSLATKTMRTYEILFPYDFLMIGLRFWSEAGAKHTSDDWYAIRFVNESNYYWMSNSDSNCDPTEDAYSDWYHVGLEIENVSDSTTYCYTDVLMYIDPLNHPGKKYKFDLEIIANVPESEFWGFSSLVMNTFDNDEICVNNIFPVFELVTKYSNVKYEYYGLKNVPSLYYGYLIFDLSFDYRFHDVSALISLSTNNSNDGTTPHWVIHLDDEQSGIWLRSGTGSIPSHGILTLNDALASTIVDTNDNDEIVYTKMYIQWNANSDQNYMRVGFGHILGKNIIASVDYNKFKFDTENPLKYVGFARSLGSTIPPARWKIYKNGLPSSCLSKVEQFKVHRTQNYKQTCIEDESGNTNLIIYDLVTPECIYYTSDVADPYALNYTFTIHDPHDYVLLNMKLFADFAQVSNSGGSCAAEHKVAVYYATDGDHFVALGNATMPDTKYFDIIGFSHLSKLRFLTQYVEYPESLAYVRSPAYFKCTLTINGVDYMTSNDTSYWRIIKANMNGKRIANAVDGVPGRIWNSHTERYTSNTIIFEFSFQNVFGSNYIKIDIDGQPNEDTRIAPRWAPSLDRQLCESKDYYDGISNQFSVGCYGSLNATFEHLSQQETFTVHFTPSGVTRYGIADIQLQYGLCRNILPLIQTNIRYKANYKYWNVDALPSIAENYVFFMIKCQLDSYESAESYISIGTNSATDPRFIVRMYDNRIEIKTSVESNGLFGETVVAQMVNNSDTIINNEHWAEFYIEWDKNIGFFRIGTGYILGNNILLNIDYYELYSSAGVIIDAVGIMHSNPDNTRDFNVITFHAVQTNEPKLCWTSALESVAEKTWMNSKLEDVWMTANNHPTVRIPTELSTSTIFNGPFASGDALSKTLTSIHEHDYIQLSTKVYGFGAWDVVYPTWLNGLSIFFSETEDDSLVWFGTFLTNGGVTNAKCDISQYKQWFSWSQPNTLNGLPLDILTPDACVYDVELYIKHNSTHDPFFLSFIGELQQTKCNAVPQFDIILDASSATTIDGYPVMLNASLNQDNYRYCHGLCNDIDTCRAWMYNVSGYCWLKSTSDLHIARKGGYVSGLCDGEYVFDVNSTCSAGATLMRAGYKADTEDYLAKFALIEGVNVSLNCHATGMFSVSASMDNGAHFRTIQNSTDSVYMMTGNMSYASQIQFNVTNNGYLSESNMYFGLEHTENLHQFIHRDETNIYLSTIPDDHDTSSYVWKIIEPGLTGKAGTVSLQTTFANITTYLTISDDNTLTAPMPVDGDALDDDVRVLCVGDNILEVLYAENGADFSYYTSQMHLKYVYDTKVHQFNVPKVSSASKIQFWVRNDDDPGLKCSIYSSLKVVSTSDDTDYWRIINGTEGNDTIEIAYDSTPSKAIEQDAEWIWDDDCWSPNVSQSCEPTTLLFEFSFTNVPIYNYEMSTFKLAACPQSGKEDAYIMKGVDKYAGYQLTLNKDDSSLILDTNASSCWYLRNANPGFGCKIDINNHSYTTNADGTLWSSATAAASDTYFDTQLNLKLDPSQYDGTWIWDQTCVPFNNASCIDSSQATFTFMLSEISELNHVATAEDCQTECKQYGGCDGWIYKRTEGEEIYPQCILKSELPIDLEVDENYVTGLNIEANQCDCICGDCYPGNEYHYIYIESTDQFKNPLYFGSTLYSHACDFSLSKDESGDLLLTNLETGNVLKHITSTELAALESNASYSWLYPVRMILDGAVLLIVDDDLNSKHIYHEQCAVQNETSSNLVAATELGSFNIASEFSIQFELEVTCELAAVAAMKIMTLGNVTLKETYFTFGWHEDHTVYVELEGVEHQITESSFNVLAKGRTHWTIKVNAANLKIWAHGEKDGYQAFKLSETNTSNITSSAIVPSTAYIIAPWHFGVDTPSNGAMKISHICVSDLPWKAFMSNEDQFDYNMRCWSGKYKDINRKAEFISSFITDSGCASVTASCATSYGEDLEYIPYFDVLTENSDYNDPSCFVGKFADPEYPPINNKLCIMLKKCESPKQSLYTKSWGFADVNLTTSICNDIVPHIIRKISIEYNDEFDINDGRLLLNSNDAYTIKNNYLIFSLRPIRFPAQGFGNRSVYISFMNVNDTLKTGQASSNITWTFELNNEFGVKFYRGDRNVTERLIATQYVQNILERTMDTEVRGYCYARNDINITYASDGERYVSLVTSRDANNITSFTLTDVSFVSKLNFLTTDVDNLNAGLLCTLYVGGDAYSTSDDTAFWNIINATSGNKAITEQSLTQTELLYFDEDAKWIWNYNCSQQNADKCVVSESIVFEFSFYNVHNPDNAPSFYFEWDHNTGDYLRFGLYNASQGGISYNYNLNLILEVGYISNIFSYDIVKDGYYGFNKKVAIDDVMFSIANDSYNEDWFVYMHIVNTTDPKPCFEYDILLDKHTRITTRDLSTFSSWTDDGRSKWELNGNTLPGWHNIYHMNATTNSTYNNIHLPYYFHYPFVSNQKSWQRSFHIDSDIAYDYIQFELDVATFCGWDHETDKISVSLAFKEYLHFTEFWESTHSPTDCSGYNAQTWDDVIDVVRINEAIHPDISCYAKGMSAPQHACTLSMRTKRIQREEDVSAFLVCDSYGASNITVTYASEGLHFDESAHNETAPNHVTMHISSVTRASKLRFNVQNYMNEEDDDNVTDSNAIPGGLKCNIIVNDTVYYTNTSEDYWSISSSSNNNKKVVERNDTLDFDSAAEWIWNEEDDDCIEEGCASFVEFEFSFYHVFVQEYDLKYINTKKINITDGSKITKIRFRASPLTTCKLGIDIDKDTRMNITIVDGEVITDTDTRLSAYMNSDTIDRMYINVQEYYYECRLDLYSDCLFAGNVTRIDTLHQSIEINNASSWKFYAGRGYECSATFYDSVNNITKTMNAEDSNMVTETCDIRTKYDSVNISIMEAHYGCYTHVRFEAPNTNSQPFVLRIAAEIEDSSTKFATYAKSWGFGNLTITPLICSSFSNIVPLKSPIILDDDAVRLTSDELSSLQYNYVFLVIDFLVGIELYMSLGDTQYDEDYWNISMSETDCKLENLKLDTVHYCVNNDNYLDLLQNITNKTHTELLMWISWEPFNMDTSLRNLSMGFGLTLNENVMASLSIYGDEFFDLHSSLDYVRFSGVKNDGADIHLLPIQFAMPKLCLSQLYKANKYDVGNTWIDSCDQANSGWELRRESYVIADDAYFEDNQEIVECPVTKLDTNPVTKIASDCFHGPFKGTSFPHEAGDYISRHFYVFSQIDYDIISVHLNYHSLCTWNPEQDESDRAFVFINNQALWKSAPQYEFVDEYCQGYELFSDWTLNLDHFEVLDSDLIQCLHLLHQICTYPVTLDFRHRYEQEETWFSVGISAQLNQNITNEAFGFSNVSISYTKCPVTEPLPIGNVIYQPLIDLNSQFTRGDMLVISSNSIYYLVADWDVDETVDNDNNSTTRECTFTLHGGYAMWSQNSSNCTISGLPIMKDYPFTDYNTYDLGIADNGFLFLQDHSVLTRLWSRRTPCEINTAYFYYLIPKGYSLGYYSNTIDSSIYSIDCKWVLMVTKQGQLNVVQNASASSNRNGVKGDIVWSMFDDVEALLFNDDGALVVSLYNDEEHALSPNGAEFMLFDEGKLVLIDQDTNEILKQYDFEFAQCKLSEDVGFIKYFYFMKPGDVLWNGEVLISKDCQYKLMLSNGSLVILDGDNEQIWSATNYSLSNNSTADAAERFEFLKDGNMVLYSYSSTNDILWQTNTSTLLNQNTIFYADRAILYEDGQLFITDNATLTPQYILFANKSQTNDIQKEYNYNLLCDSTKYDYVDKRNGFYASYISYFNCEDNEYVFGGTTTCVAYTYCPAVQRYENILLEPSGTQTNCMQYTTDYWRSFANDYILFQVSIKNTEVTLEPQLSMILTTSRDIRFGHEFDSSYAKHRTLLVTVSPLKQTVALTTKYNTEEFYVPSLFDVDSQIEWVWIDWNVNFDTIRIGNSKYISAPLHTVKYSKFFQEKLSRNEDLFSHLNLAWDTKDHTCYGIVIVQLPPLNDKVPKGCHEAFNYTVFEAPATTRVPSIFTNDSAENTKAQDDDNESQSNESQTISSTAIALIVAGCFIAIAAISAIVLRWKHGFADHDNIVTGTKYDVEHIDVDYVRMEDQDDGL